LEANFAELQSKFDDMCRRHELEVSELQAVIMEESMNGEAQSRELEDVRLELQQAYAQR